MTIILNKGEYGHWSDFDCVDVLNQVASACLKSEGYDTSVELSVSFSDEEEIREANRSFRGKDAPTDVLSFPMLEFDYEDGIPAPIDETMDENPDTGELLLGDIMLCIPRVVSQAEEFGHSIKREYAFLLAHSMLHLLGYDHQTEEE